MYKEEYVLITFKGKGIFVGKRDERGAYRILLVQSRGKCQLIKPTERAKKYLQHANCVYDLPSTEEAITWMHAVCGYPDKPTWIKAVKAGNFMGWTMLNGRNVKNTIRKKMITQRGT